MYGGSQDRCGKGRNPRRGNEARASTKLVERGVFVVELNLGHLDEAAPLGFVPQAVLERALGVLLANEELYRFRVVKLRERIQAHRMETVFRYPWRSKRFKVSTPVFRWPWRKGARSGSRRSTGGLNASSSKAIPLSGGLVIRNRRSRSWSSRRCQLLAVAPQSLVLGIACLRPQTTPGFRGRVLVGWLYLS